MTIEFRAPVLSLAADLANYIRNTGEIRADFGMGICSCAVELIQEWDHTEDSPEGPTDTERITLEFDTERLAANLRNTIRQYGYIKADFGRGPTICRVAVVEEGAYENDRGDSGPRQRPAGAAGQAGSGASADAMVAEVNSPGVGCDVEMWLKEGSPRRLNGRIAAIDGLGSVVLDNLQSYLPGTKMWIPGDNIACVAWGGKEEAEDEAAPDRNSGLHHSGEAEGA